jgi:hypothetical protein
MKLLRNFSTIFERFGGFGKIKMESIQKHKVPFPVPEDVIKTKFLSTSPLLRVW